MAFPGETRRPAPDPTADLSIPLHPSDETQKKKELLGIKVETLRVRFLNVYGKDPQVQNNFPIPNGVGRYQDYDKDVWSLLYQTDSTPNSSTITLSLGSIHGDPFGRFHKTLEPEDQSKDLDAVSEIDKRFDELFPPPLDDLVGD